MSSVIHNRISASVVMNLRATVCDAYFYDLSFNCTQFMIMIFFPMIGNSAIVHHGASL